jgi:chromosome segregation ATPase
VNFFESLICDFVENFIFETAAILSEFPSLSFPFEGDFAERVSSILKLGQLSTIQRIQLFINEVAKNMNENDKVTKELKRKNAEQAHRIREFGDTQPTYCALLHSLLDELKAIAVTDTQLSGSVPCKNDPRFKQFIADKAAELEPLVKDKVVADSQFIKHDFFTTADAAKRLQAIDQVLEKDDQAFAILASQFLTNQMLKNQLDAIMGTIGKLERISQMDIMQGEDVADLPAIFQRTQEQLSKLKEKYKQLHAVNKKAQGAQVGLAKAEAAAKAKVGQLQGQLENLQNEYDVLKVKFQVATSELHVRAAPIEVQAGPNEEEHAEVKARTQLLEEALTQKSKECSELSTLLKKLQTTLEDSLKKQNRHFAHQEDSLRKQIIEMQGQLDAMETQLVSKKKSAKRNERSLKEQYDASIRELTAHYEEPKKALLRTIEDLKEKAKAAREMSKKLVDSMSASEQLNQRLQAEGNELKQGQKALKSELAQTKQQTQKELQHIQAQLSAQTLAFESKIHTATAEAKTHLKGLLEAVSEAIGSYYNVDEAAFSESDFRELLVQLKDDLAKLQLIQFENARQANIAAEASPNNA